MKLVIYALTGILFLSNIATAQRNDNNIRIKLGYGSYDMGDIEYLQKILKDIYMQQQIPATIVDQFPSYWNFQLQYSRKINDSFNTMFFLGYSSTGGRLHYSDYSGEVKSDQIVAANFYGAGIEYYFNPLESFRYFGAVQICLLYSSLELSYFFKVYDTTDNLTTSFRSFGIGVEPLVGIEYGLSPLLFRFEIGLLLSGQGTFYFNEQNDVPLKINQKEISPNWTGYRAGLSVGYEF